MNATAGIEDDTRLRRGTYWLEDVPFVSSVDRHALVVLDGRDALR